MARRRYGRKRSSGGLGSLMPLLYGAGAAYVAPKVGINFNPLIIGAGAGFFARKNIMGAVMGAAGAYAANMFLGSGSSATSSSNSAAGGF